MNSWWFKIKWYLLSMWLLAVIVFILTINVPICLDWPWNCDFLSFIDLWELNGPLPFLAFIILLIDVNFFYELKYRFNGSPDLSLKVKRIKSLNGDSLSFLASYFVPLVSFSLPGIRHSFVLGVLFICIGIMYVRGNMFHMNPTLLILGFRFYEVDLIGGEMDKIKIKEIILLSSESMKENSEIRYHRLTDNIWYARIQQSK